jgi:hypothetical protein
LSIGSNVIINLWYSYSLVVLHILRGIRAMAQNEARFPDPTLFRPERHLTLDGKIVEDTLRPLFVFGLGR